MIKHAIILLLSLTYFTPQAQTPVDSTSYEEVKSLLNFYEYMLNSIGSERTSTRDKEVIITESYKKVFVDSDVQIEDDLLDDRKVITNKDVTAYLRDVDFFFQNIQFDFNESKIEKIDRGDESSFFLVTFESSIDGTTLEGDTYRVTQKRFLEVNFNEEADDLKIASVYTNKVSRDKELKNWWSNLSFGWKNVFETYVPYDSITSSVLAKMAAVDSLYLEGNTFIRNLEPLAALKELQYLNISRTKINDLEPLRYSMQLKTLLASNSEIEEINSLQYFEGLRMLDISSTRVDDLSPLSSLKNLEHLNLSSTYAFAFDPLSDLTHLTHLNLTDTEFKDFSLLYKAKNIKTILLGQTKVNTLNTASELTELQELDVSESKISSIEGLSHHPSLKFIYFNRTEVSDISPLLNAPSLRKIFADYTNVSEEAATQFMTKRPEVLVVTNSEKVMEWWGNLPANWKNVFGTIMGSENPNKEELIKLINQDSMQLRGKNFFELDPLKKFKRLKYLDISKNLFTSLEFTREMSDLTYFIGEDLPVESLSDLGYNSNLKHINIQGSLVEEISPLYLLRDLEYLNVDNTLVNENGVIQLLQANPSVAIIYQTDKLKDWWSELSPEWKKLFSIEQPSSLALHKLIEKNMVIIESSQVSTLKPLDVFINLTEVTLNNVRVTNLQDLYKHKRLERITCTSGPLQSLEGITQLSSLSSLNVMNTGIEDLKDLEGLVSMKHLNCAGTSIKNLKGISELINLETLNVSNTRVWKLQRLYGMQNLKKLVCFNTRLRQHTIDDFKMVFPDVEINFY